MNNNDDLISRETLRHEMYEEAFMKDSDMQKWDGGCWIRYKLFERVVDRQPAAQPEIIRCRDCKNWDQTWQPSCGPGYYYCPMIDMVTNGDFYCADAERRTENE